jgi:tRNA threonylcarbamoyl adenosine modification protein YeaZ
VLALDGALGGFSVALIEDGSVIGSQALVGNVALERGLAAVDELLNATGMHSQALDRLAVVTGPGTFTGLRIAITYAKALAQAWKLPLVPVSAFDALEYGRDLNDVLTVVVGRPGIISARRRTPGGEQRASGPSAEVVAALTGGLPQGTLDIVNGPEDVLRALAEAGFTVTPWAPLVTPPAAAAGLAAERARPAASAHDVRADYGEAVAARVPVFRETRREP